MRLKNIATLLLLPSIMWAESATFPGFEKLDVHTRATWETLRVQQDDWFECIIKLSKPPKKRQLTKLRRAGFEYRTIAGNIMTGRIRVSDLQGLTVLKFVKVVEGNSELRTKN